LLEEVENYLHQLAVKVAELNEENNVLRDEFQKMQSQNTNLNKRILYFTEKIKLYQESVTGGSSSE
jgi:FtsZ-binding cell division protein ZapB